MLDSLPWVCDNALRQTYINGPLKGAQMSEFTQWMRAVGIITMILATAIVMWAIIIVTIIIAVGTF